MLNSNNVKDIEDAIIYKIVRRSVKDLKDVKIGFSVEDRVTFASVTWIDKKGEIQVRHGIGVKRKGDKYSREVGELIALMDII